MTEDTQLIYLLQFDIKSPSAQEYFSCNKVIYTPIPTPNQLHYLKVGKQLPCVSFLCFASRARVA